MTCFETKFKAYPAARTLCQVPATRSCESASEHIFSSKNNPNGAP